MQQKKWMCDFVQTRWLAEKQKKKTYKIKYIYTDINMTCFQSKLNSLQDSLLFYSVKHAHDCELIIMYSSFFIWTEQKKYFTGSYISGCITHKVLKLSAVGAETLNVF